MKIEIKGIQKTKYNYQANKHSITLKKINQMGLPAHQTAEIKVKEQQYELFKLKHRR